MSYDHNKNVGLFKFQSGFKHFYLNSPKRYSQIIYVQTNYNHYKNYLVDVNTYLSPKKVVYFIL